MVYSTSSSFQLFQMKPITPKFSSQLKLTLTCRRLTGKFIPFLTCCQTWEACRAFYPPHSACCFPPSTLAAWTLFWCNASSDFHTLQYLGQIKLIHSGRGVEAFDSSFSSSEACENSCSFGCQGSAGVARVGRRGP